MSGINKLDIVWRVWFSCKRKKIEMNYCIYGPKSLYAKVSDKMAYENSVDPDQTAPEGAV